MDTLLQTVISMGIGAIIGGGTNWLAIKALFRPINPRWYSLYWQGVIPRNKNKLGRKISEEVEDNLLDSEDLIKELQNPIIQKELNQFVSNKIDHFLSANLAFHFAQFSPDWQGKGLDKVLQSVLEGIVDWSNSESGRQVKERLLEALEARLGKLRVDQLVPEKQVGELIATITQSLSNSKTRNYLIRTLETRLKNYLGSDIPIEEIIPGDLRRLLRNRLRSGIPETLDRVANWLSDPKHVESVVTATIKALDTYAEQAGWGKRFLAKVGLTVFRSDIRRTLRQRIPDLAREYLRSEEIRSKVTGHLRDAVTTLLRKPVSEVLEKKHRESLAKGISSIAASWISSDEAQDAIAKFLRRYYDQHRKDRFEEIIPEGSRRDLRKHLIKRFYLPKRNVRKWSLQLGSFLREQVQRSKAPVRQSIDLSTDDETAIIQKIQTVVLGQLMEYAPLLISKIEIKKIVEEKITEMDLLDLEEIIQAIVKTELRYIMWAGAGIGAFVGCFLPFLLTFLSTLSLP